ncbi:hypothetical protein D3C72_1839070 [compost metagenome]
MRINHAEQLAFLHPVANFDVQAFQLPADLRTHVHLANRVELTGRQYVLLQTAQGDLHRFKLGWRRVPKVPDRRHSDYRRYDQRDYPASFVSFKPRQNRFLPVAIHTANSGSGAKLSRTVRNN